jgi:PAS domain S-box-containing protein
MRFGRGRQSYRLGIDGGRSLAKFVLVSIAKSGEAAAPQETFEAAILDHVRAAVIVADEHLRITYCNPAAAELLGASGQETPGWSLAELFQGDGASQQVARGDYAGELQCRRRDGSVFAAQVRAAPFNLPGRSARGVVLSMQEVARTEAELRKSHELLRLAQVAAMVGIWEWDPATQELWWTPELAVLYGYPAEDVHSYSDWSSRVNPNDLRRVEDERTRALAEHRPFDVEFRLEHPSGSTRWLRTRGGAIYDEHGRPSRVFGITIDMTERRRIEEALREAERKDEFLAVLSHELRNPLTPIRNSLAILERAVPGGSQALRAQAVIGRQVGHLARLVDDLLDVTRIARGKAQLQQDRFELGEIVGRTVEDYRAAFVNGGIAFVDAISADSMWLVGDATRITQVVGNLLSNEVKFTPRGGRVRLTLERRDDTAVLSVRDDGQGIAPDVLDHIFEPFAQAPQTPDRRSGGLGLGLALVRGLVQLHGGSVAVSSAGLGRGAEFTVHLPLEALPVMGAEPAASNRRIRRRRVLIIEDNTEAADTLREVLELSGHEVQVAFDGPGGLRDAGAFHPDVVLCDIGLPGMTGYEVARALRADERLRGTLLVALTGYSLPEDKRRASDAGFAHHVRKPPNLDELLGLVDTTGGERQRPSPL